MATRYSTLVQVQVNTASTLLVRVKKRLAQAEKRISELDRLFIRIYEDNVAGTLDDEKFAMMSKNYTQEQKASRLRSEVCNRKLKNRNDRQII